MKLLIDSARESLAQLQKYAHTKEMGGEDWRVRTLVHDAELSEAIEKYTKQEQGFQDIGQELEERFKESLDEKQFDKWETLELYRDRDSRHNRCRISWLEKEFKDTLDDDQQKLLSQLEDVTREWNIISEQLKHCCFLQNSVIHCPIPASVDEAQEGRPDYLEAVAELLYEASSQSCKKAHLNFNFVNDDKLIYCRTNNPEVAHDHMEQMSAALDKQSGIAHQLANPNRWRRMRTSYGNAYVLDSINHHNDLCYKIADILSYDLLNKNRFHQFLVVGGKMIAEDRFWNNYNWDNDSGEARPRTSHRLVIPEAVARQVLPVQGVEMHKIKDMPERGV